MTPKSYLSFIAGYKELYARKWAATRELAASIQAGLQKMVEAKEDVNRMKAELAVKNQELAAASRDAEALLQSISESTAVAEREKAKVAVIVGEVSSKAAEIAAVKVLRWSCYLLLMMRGVAAVAAGLGWDWARLPL